MFSCIFSFTFVLLVYQAAGEDDTAHLPGHMQPLGSHRPMEGDIERLDRIPDPVTFYEEYVEKKRPFVLEGAVKDTVPVKMWTDEYLKSHFGNITVSVELRKKEDRHGPGGKMTLQEFIGRYNEESVYVVDDVPQVMRSVVSMPGCLCCGGFLQNTHMALMWFSSGGTKSVLHTDTAHNMHCLVAGEKRFVMIPPEFAKTIGPEWERQGYYNLDVEAVNMTAYPNMVDVPWYRAVLQPGDCMFLPFNWVHQVNSYNRNLGLNFWFFPFPLNYTDCPDDMPDKLKVVSVKDAKPMENADIILQFYKFGRIGRISTADFKESVDSDYVDDKLPFSADFLTPSLLNQIFETLRPGSRGKIHISQLQYVTLDKWRKAQEMMKDPEMEYLTRMIEELEQKGLPIPDSIELVQESKLSEHNSNQEDSWHSEDNVAESNDKKNNDAQHSEDAIDSGHNTHQEL